MNLIEYREKHGPDAWAHLAPKADTTVAYLIQLAHGHRDPSVKLAKKLVKASNGELTLEALRPDIYGPDQFEQECAEETGRAA